MEVLIWMTSDAPKLGFRKALMYGDFTVEVVWLEAVPPSLPCFAMNPAPLPPGEPPPRFLGRYLSKNNL